MNYNPDQEKVIKEAVDFYKNSAKQVYEFTGGPGTGKTTTMLGIVKALGLSSSQILPMAYIGQAAINMRQKGLPNAKTIHSSIYITEKVLSDSVDGTFNRPKFEFVTKDRDLSSYKLMLIDEGSSVPLSKKVDIEKHGIKIIVTGDIDQLPPVMDKSAYLNNPDTISRLRIKHRQMENSGILYLADRALQGLPILVGNYGDSLVVEEDDFPIDILVKADAVICGTNKTRDKLTHRIRHDLLSISNELPVHGERVVFRRNNWDIEKDGINIANGLRGIITNSPTAIDMNDGAFLVNFKPDKFDSIFEDLPCNYKYLMAEHTERMKLKFDKFNYGEKLEFGYAITCHVSQGSEYDRGVFFEEYMGDLMNKFVYTGITRFKKNMVFVKKKKKYY